jgi:hypothetical protein
MKFKLFILALFFAISVFAFDFSKTEFLSIPEGNVYKIKNSDGKILWSVIPYVNEGLVDWWDAKWNTGIGQHDNEATRWKDLVGTRDAALFTNYYWTDDSWVVQSVSNNGLAAMTGGQFPKSQTWQIVLHPTNYIYGGRLLVGPIKPRITSTNGISFYDSYGINSGARNNIDNFSSLQLHQHTITHEEDSPIMKYWIDGKCIYTNNSATANSDTSQYLYFANQNQRNIGIDAEYHTVRLYDRVLTDDEIFKNTIVDVKRYGIPQYWSEFSFSDGSTDITNLTSMDTRYRANPDLVDVRLGTDCTNISARAFQDCTNLTSAVLPNTLTQLSTYLFYHDYNLESIVFPENATSIQMYTCSRNEKLTNIVFPKSLKYIYSWAFAYCNSLIELEIPNTVLEISSSAFKYCNNLSNVTGTTNIIRLGEAVFGSCPNLTEFTFGPNIETLGTNVFQNSGIQTIKYYKKDTETNEEAESRIKTLVEGTGLDITDKEFICMNYDYSSSAWSHIDMTDVNTLFTDDALTIHPEIGESVPRIQDKANQDIVYRASTNMIRTEYGIKSTKFDDEGEALMIIIYQTNELFNAETDYNNVEFATAIVIDNENGSTDFSTHVTRIIQPQNYKVFNLYYGSSSTDRGLTIRALNNTQIYVPPIHRKNFQDGPQLFVVSVKSVDGQVVAKVYVNGVLVGTYNTTVGEDIAGTAFIPAIGTSGNNTFVPADYCENLWWDHIPENIDEIQQALMRKYGIQKQTIYSKDAFSWIELTDEGTMFKSTTIASTNQASIGDEVLTCRDKITTYLWTVSGMVRTEDGLRPTNIVSNDYAETWQLYQNTSGPKIKPANTDWANMEMAFAIMTCNDTCTDREFSIVRLMECAYSSYITRLYYSDNSRLYSRLLSSTARKVPTDKSIPLRNLVQNKPTLYVCQLKVVDGVATEIISVNGYKFTISNTIDPDYVSGRYVIPGIKSNSSYAGMPVDYQEVLFWDHIPEDIDDIEKALMEKYNIEPLVIE